MFNKQQKNANFGQRWQLESNTSGSDSKTFLWGQPPDFGFTAKTRNDLVGPLPPSQGVSPSKKKPSSKSRGDAFRPPWEDSSEEEKEGTATEGKGTEEKRWDMEESGWGQRTTEQVGSSSVPNAEVTNVASTSVDVDQNKDKNRVAQQPFFGRRRRVVNAFEKIVFRSANSGLTILMPKGHLDLPAAFRIASETYSHGYNTANASKALDRFVKRKLLCVERMQCLAKEEPTAWNSTVQICRKFITVPSIGVRNTKFEGHGATLKEAVDNCDLAILFELFDFDVIKEANVEINNMQRKLESVGYGAKIGLEDAGLARLFYGKIRRKTKRNFRAQRTLLLIFLYRVGIVSVCM
ncbi:hypothetical protein niasHT_035140 [Heterodera trifolii]|uniref:Uncharacterized protein n=1 Tax=Heterodera trifolii TaxID=157864 RepID=A0ABD2IWL8_9BILA